MIRLDLVPHPDTPGRGIDRIEVVLSPAACGHLAIHFAIAGDLARMRLPQPTETSRLDGLWRHTCCEIFVRGGQASAYREYNFSPSGAWQAYDFEAYRQGGRPAVISQPQTSWSRSPEHLSLRVWLDEEHLPAARPLRFGLAVVLEDRHGILSYWALAHPASHPDFHHPDAFCLRMA